VPRLLEVQRLKVQGRKFFAGDGGFDLHLLSSPRVNSRRRRPNAFGPSRESRPILRPEPAETRISAAFPHNKNITHC
jgi:hypothetical protein